MQSLSLLVLFLLLCYSDLVGLLQSVLCGSLSVSHTAAAVDVLWCIVVVLVVLGVDDVMIDVPAVYTCCVTLLLLLCVFVFFLHSLILFHIS